VANKPLTHAKTRVPYQDAMGPPIIKPCILLKYSKEAKLTAYPVFPVAAARRCTYSLIKVKVAVIHPVNDYIERYRMMTTNGPARDR